MLSYAYSENQKSVEKESDKTLFTPNQAVG